MGEIALFVLKFMSRFVFILAGITAFIIMLNMAVSLAFVSFSAGAFSDVFAMVSMWLPFNLSVLLAWLMSAATAYIGYRLALTALIWVNRITN